MSGDWSLVQIAADQSLYSERDKLIKGLPLLGPPDVLIIREAKKQSKFFASVKVSRAFVAPLSGLFTRSPAHICAFFQKVLVGRAVGEGFQIESLSYLAYDCYLKRDTQVELVLPGKLNLLYIGCEDKARTSKAQPFQQEQYFTVFVSTVLRFFSRVQSSNGRMFSELCEPKNLGEVVSAFVEVARRRLAIGDETYRITNHQNLGVYILFKGLLSMNYVKAALQLLRSLEKADVSVHAVLSAVLLFFQGRYEECVRFCKARLQQDQEQPCLLFYLSSSLAALEQRSKALRILKYILHFEKSTFLFKVLSETLFRCHSVVLALNLCNSLYKVSYLEPPVDQCQLGLQRLWNFEKVVNKQGERLSQRTEFLQEFRLPWVFKFGSLKQFLDRVRNFGKEHNILVRLVESHMEALRPISRTKDMIFQQVAELVKTHGEEAVREMRKSTFWLKSDLEEEEYVASRKLSESFIELNKHESSIVREMREAEGNSVLEDLEFETPHRQQAQIEDCDELGQAPHKSVCEPELDNIFKQVFKDYELDRKAKLLEEGYAGKTDQMLEVQLKAGKDRRGPAEDKELRELQGVASYLSGLLSLKLLRLRDAEGRLRKALKLTKRIVVRLGCNFQLAWIYLAVRNYRLAMIFIEEMLSLIELMGVREMDLVPPWLEKFLHHLLENDEAAKAAENFPRLSKLLEAFIKRNH